MSRFAYFFLFWFVVIARMDEFQLHNLSADFVFRVPKSHFLVLCLFSYFSVAAAVTAISLLNLNCTKVHLFLLYAKTAAGIATTSQ